MKRLLFLILLSPLAYASEMDSICSIQSNSSSKSIEQQIIEKGCVRNNILQVYFGPASKEFESYAYLNKRNLKTWDKISLESNRWCRFDRNRLIMDTGFSLSCVLYSTKPRRVVEK